MNNLVVESGVANKRKVEILI